MQRIVNGPVVAFRNRVLSDQRPMTLKIERTSGKRRTRIRLSGAFRSEHLDQVKVEIERGGPRLALDLEEVDLADVDAIFVRTDVRKDEDVRNLVDQTVKRFGRLDIAVNNAGTEGLRGLVTEQTAESYADTFDTNVLGVLLSMKHELRAMLPQGSGSIVNVSSAYGSVGAAGASVYVASKHAVEGMTKSAALEVAESGVRVNVIAVGTTETGMLTRFTNTDENKAALVSTVPVKRLATPEEIAHVIAFVASTNASYMTGASIPVDGGMLAD